METPNVNNLNGIPNFGFGLPEDGIVIAGVTDVPHTMFTTSEDSGEDSGEDSDVVEPEVTNQENNNEKETESAEANVTNDESQEEEVNGE
jgi:hypothetical protein